MIKIQKVNQRKKSSSKSQESSSTIYDRAKNGVGIAFAGTLKAAEATIKGATVAMAVQAFSGLGGAHALSTSDAPSTALVSPDSGSRDGNNATAFYLDQRGLLHSSNQTNLERSLGKVTPEELKQMGVKNPERFLQNRQKLEQNLQQRVQKRKQRQDMRRLAEKAQENPESLSKLFEEMPEQASSETHLGLLDKGTEHHTSYKEQMERMRVVIEELKANPNPELMEHARKLLAESRQLTESSETDRRKLAVPRVPCLQWVPPFVSKGTLTDITLPGGVTGQGVLVDYKLNILNTCHDDIGNVKFAIDESYNCPANCVSLTGRREGTTNGVPSMIEQGKISTGNQVWTDYCIQQDLSGAQTAVPPEVIVATVYANGLQNEQYVLSGPQDLAVYP